MAQTGEPKVHKPTKTRFTVLGTGWSMRRLYKRKHFQPHLTFNIIVLVVPGRGQPYFWKRKGIHSTKRKPDFNNNNNNNNNNNS